MGTLKRVVCKKGNQSSGVSHHVLPLRSVGGDDLGESLQVTLVSGLHDDVRSWH